VSLPGGVGDRGCVRSAARRLAVDDQRAHTVPMNNKARPFLVLAGYISIVHVPVTALTWRDLRERPATEVRGDKRIWRIATAANTVGSVAYWLFGRRHVSASR
jgi:predicted cobalt transporter CbtA